MLTPKEQRFVAEYPIDLNGAAAAKRAGYAPGSAKVTAARLLKKLTIKAALQNKEQQHVAAVTEATASTDLTALRVLEELRRIAFIDPALYYDPKGEVLSVHALPVEARAALHSIELVMKNATAGDGQIDRVLKFRVHDKLKALEMLAKHFSLLVERLEVIDKTGLLDKIAKARARASKK